MSSRNTPSFLVRLLSSASESRPLLRSWRRRRPPDSVPTAARNSRKAVLKGSASLCLPATSPRWRRPFKQHHQRSALVNNRVHSLKNTVTSGRWVPPLRSGDIPPDDETALEIGLLDGSARREAQVTQEQPMRRAFFHRPRPPNNTASPAQDRVRLRDALIASVRDRDSFEATVGGLISEILGSPLSSEVPSIAVEMCLECVRQPLVALPSRALAIELLENLVVLDRRCLEAFASRASYVTLMVGVALLSSQSPKAAQSAAVQLPPNCVRSDVEQLSAAAKRALTRWASHAASHASELPENTVERLKCAVLDLQRGEAGGKTEGSSLTLLHSTSSSLAAPLQPDTVDGGPGLKPSILTSTVPVLSATMIGAALPADPTPRARSLAINHRPQAPRPGRRRRDAGNPSSSASPRNVRLTEPQAPRAPPPLDPPTNDKVEDHLGASLALVELAQETLRQASGPEARPMVQDFVQQAENEMRALKRFEDVAVERDPMLVPQIQKVQEDLRSMVADGRKWLAQASSQPRSAPPLSRVSSGEGRTLALPAPSAESPRHSRRSGRRRERSAEGPSPRMTRQPSMGSPRLADEFSSDPFASMSQNAAPVDNAEAPLSARTLPVSQPPQGPTLWPPAPSTAPPTPVNATNTPRPTSPTSDPFLSATWAAPFSSSSEVLRPPSPRHEEAVLVEEGDGGRERGRRGRDRHKRGHHRKEGDGDFTASGVDVGGYDSDDGNRQAFYEKQLEESSSSIKRLEARLGILEASARETAARHSEELRLAGEELRLLRGLLAEKEAEIAKLGKELNAKLKELDDARFELKDRTTSLQEAKELWMRENKRSAGISESLEELEKKYAAQQTQLLNLSKKHEEVQRECTALKGLIKSDFDDPWNPNHIKTAALARVGLYSSYPPPALRLMSRTPPIDIEKYRSLNLPLTLLPSPVQRNLRAHDFHHEGDTPEISPQSLRRGSRSMPETKSRISPLLDRCGPNEVSSPKAVKPRRPVVEDSFTFGDSADEEAMSMGERFGPAPLLQDYLLTDMEKDIFQRFRNLLSCNDAVLYEDTMLQVGFKASGFKGLTATTKLYLGNLSPSALQSLRVTLHGVAVDRGEILLDCSLLQSELLPRQQTYQSIVVSCVEPYEHWPTLNIGYLLPDNSPTVLELSFPIPVTKFMEGRALDHNSFFSYWRHDEFAAREVTAIVKIDTQLYGRSKIKIAQAMQLEGAMRLLPGIDPTSKSLVLSSIFPNSGCLAAIPTSLVLVRFELGTGAYRETGRITVRSDSIVLARAVRNILSVLLSVPSRLTLLPA